MVAVLIYIAVLMVSAKTAEQPLEINNDECVILVDIWKSLTGIDAECNDLLGVSNALKCLPEEPLCSSAERSSHVTEITWRSPVKRTKKTKSIDFSTLKFTKLAYLEKLYCVSKPVICMALDWSGRCLVGNFKVPG